MQENSTERVAAFREAREGLRERTIRYLKELPS